MTAAARVALAAFFWLGATIFAAEILAGAAGFVAHVAAYVSYRRRYPSAPRRVVWRYTR